MKAGWTVVLASNRGRRGAVVSGLRAAKISSTKMGIQDNCVWAEFGQINAAGAVGWASQDKDSRPLSELR